MYDDIFSTLEHWSTGFHMREPEETKLSELSSPESLLSLIPPTDHDTGALYPDVHISPATGEHMPEAGDTLSSHAHTHIHLPTEDTHHGYDYERILDVNMPLIVKAIPKMWTSDALDYQLQAGRINSDSATENPYQTGDDAHMLAEDAHAHHPHEEPPIEHEEPHIDHDEPGDKAADDHPQVQESSMGHSYPSVFNPHPETPQTDHEGHNPPINPNDLRQSLGSGTMLYSDDMLVPYVDTHPWVPGHFQGIGHPDVYSQNWQQQTGEDCAVIAQGNILSSITGHQINEQQLCAEASSHHIYDSRTGTHCADLGKLLEQHGIHTKRIEDANFADLKQALQNDQRVMVGVNANEIWFPHRDTSTGEPAKLPYSGHAVWVTGIDTTPMGVKVILSDSGPAFGHAEAVDLDDFLNAWHDTNNLMVITKSSYSPIVA